MLNLLAVLVDREKFSCLFNQSHQLCGLWLHLERSSARRCLVFHCLLSKPNFSGVWAGKGARWVVFHVCASTTKERSVFLYMMPTLVSMASDWELLQLLMFWVITLRLRYK